MCGRPVQRRVHDGMCGVLRRIGNRHAGQRWSHASCTGLVFNVTTKPDGTSTVFFQPDDDGAVWKMLSSEDWNEPSACAHWTLPLEPLVEVSGLMMKEGKRPDNQQGTCCLPHGLLYEPLHAEQQTKSGSSWVMYGKYMQLNLTPPSPPSSAHTQHPSNATDRSHLQV